MRRYDTTDQIRSPHFTLIHHDLGLHTFIGSTAMEEIARRVVNPAEGLLGGDVLLE